MEYLSSSEARIDPNFIFYFLSTIAQCVASLVGLIGTLCVFRYQRMEDDIVNKQKHITLFYNRLSLLPKVLGIKEKVSEQTEDSARIKILSQHVIPLIDSGYKSDWSNADLTQKVSESLKLDANHERTLAKVNEEIGWKFEFRHLALLEQDIELFRLAAIRSSTFGLVIVCIAILGLNLADIEFQVWVKIAYLAFAFGLTLFYVLLVAGVMRKTFKQPSRAFELKKNAAA